MLEKRIVVWVQAFKDRPNLVLQWLEPETGLRRSKSARTDDRTRAEHARADLEYELNHGLYHPIPRVNPVNVASLVQSLPALAVPGRYVYFARQLPAGPVKIGTARNPDNRLAELQVAC